MNVIQNQSVDEYVTTEVQASKRALDIIAAAVGLVLTALLLPFIAIAIKWETPGPIFFKQMRIGQRDAKQTKIFHMIKFRTMGTDAEKKGAQWASQNDARVTTVGRFLRKTRLDELPQFINVLMGDMSLIGPRPERPVFYQKLEDAIPMYSERTYGLKPGITGLAQVSQGYDSCLDDVRSKLLYDNAYALSLGNFKAWLAMECHIIFKTIAVMVLGRGQ